MARCYYHITITRQSPPTVAPAITGPTAMALTVGYSATSTAAYTMHRFSAVVSGSNNPVQIVLWTVAGNNHAGTTINDGLLTIAAEETATTLIVQPQRQTRQNMERLP